MNVDMITLKGLRARGFHGVLESERIEGQDFIVDLTVWIDTRRAGETDDLNDTIDYDVLALEVVEILAGQPVNLIETLAANIAERILAHALVTEVEVVLHKPQAPLSVPFDDVVITIRRLAQ